MEEQKYCMMRHGEKGKDGNLVVEAIPGLYEQGEKALREFYRQRDNDRVSMLVHTPSKRTLHTARCVLAGALGLAKPKSLDEIDGMELPQNFQEVIEDRLGEDEIQFDMDYVGKIGPVAYMNEWITNPKSRQLAEKPMTTGNKAKWITRCTLSNYIELGNTDSAIIATHGGVIEPLVTGLIESSGKEVKSLDDIGGRFNVGDAAYLTLTRDDSGIMLSRFGTLERAGKSYQVDLANFYVEKPEVP